MHLAIPADIRVNTAYNALTGTNLEVGPFNLDRLFAGFPIAMVIGSAELTSGA